MNKVTSHRLLYWRSAMPFHQTEFVWYVINAEPFWPQKGLTLKLSKQGSNNHIFHTQVHKILRHPTACQDPGLRLPDRPSRVALTSSPESS